jgi:hypothetical protein
LQSLHGYIFRILQHFATKLLCNCTHFSMLFLAVVIYLHLLVLKLVYNGNYLLTVILRTRGVYGMIADEVCGTEHQPYIRREWVEYNYKSIHPVLFQDFNIKVSLSGLNDQQTLKIRLHPGTWKKKCLNAKVYNFLVGTSSYLVRMQSAYNLSCTVEINVYISSTLSLANCVLDLHSTTQIVSRLPATVLGKSCVV